MDLTHRPSPGGRRAASARALSPAATAAPTTTTSSSSAAAAAAAAAHVLVTGRRRSATIPGTTPHGVLSFSSSLSAAACFPLLFAFVLTVEIFQRHCALVRGASSHGAVAVAVMVVVMTVVDARLR